MHARRASTLFASLILATAACAPAPADMPPAAIPSIRTPPADPTTYYIRPDGGDYAQCTGLADAPYPGNGADQPCAWDHPFRALPP